MQDGRGGIDFKCLCTSENIRGKTNFPAIDIKTLKQGNYMSKDT